MVSYSQSQQREATADNNNERRLNELLSGRHKKSISITTQEIRQDFLLFHDIFSRIGRNCYWKVSGRS